MVAAGPDGRRPVVFARSVIGRSHSTGGKPCQDASLCAVGKRCSLIAVADGHGGAGHFRSDTGSRFAVEAARSCLTDEALPDSLSGARGEKERAVRIRQLKKSIVGCWSALVEEHLSACPFTEAELGAVSLERAALLRCGKDAASAYGSTLIAALWTDRFLLVLQIGDGSCAAVGCDGVFSMPVPGDENCFLGVTASLCEENAVRSFRHYYGDVPAAVLIGSDGVGDSFADEGKLFDFYRVVLESFALQDETDARAQLLDYLPRLSEKGSGDDLSVAMIASGEALSKFRRVERAAGKGGSLK